MPAAARCRASALVVVAAMGLLAGCGRRGPLEPPDGTAPGTGPGAIVGQDLSSSATIVNTTDLPTAQGAGTLADTGPVGTLQSPTQSVQAPAVQTGRPRKPFVLDPLL